MNIENHAKILLAIEEIESKLDAVIQLLSDSEDETATLEYTTTTHLRADGSRSLSIGIDSELFSDAALLRRQERPLRAGPRERRYGYGRI